MMPKQRPLVQTERLGAPGLPRRETIRKEMLQCRQSLPGALNMFQKPLLKSLYMGMAWEVFPRKLPRTYVQTSIVWQALNKSSEKF